MRDEGRERRQNEGRKRIKKTKIGEAKDGEREMEEKDRKRRKKRKVGREGEE